MLRFVSISQDGRAVKTYGNVVGGSHITTNMKLPMLCLLGVFSLPLVFAAAETEYYSDISPEDYYIDQIANSFQLNNGLLRAASAHEPDPGPLFTYEFLPTSEKETTKFAVRPSDPRYYQDTRVTPSQKDESVMLQKPSERQSYSVVDDDTFQVPRPGDVTYAPAPDEQTEQTDPKDALYSRAQVIQTPVHGPDDKTDIYFIAIVAGCSAAAVVGVIVIGVSWYKLQKNAKLAADVEYPAYGVTGPNKETSPTGDRKLAHSAQMYHYQHQKQQIIAMESQAANERNGSVSEAESDEENEEGDYTVYECPGLAPTGEMEVKNPLFLDDATPATPAPTNQNKDSPSGDLNKTKK